MKKKYLFVVLILSMGIFVSCNEDNESENNSVRRLSKIEELNGDGDYTSFTYNSSLQLNSIEDGDEDGIHEKINISYEGQMMKMIQIYDPELYATMNVRYNNDTVFITGEDNYRGEIRDTLIINTIKSSLLSLLNKKITGYLYNNQDNLISVTNKSQTYSYDDKPSFYSTTGLPFWFLNYIYTYYDFIENYASPNNIVSTSNNGEVLEQYSYEYDSQKYPTKMYITDIYNENDGYRITYYE